MKSEDPPGRRCPSCGGTGIITKIYESSRFDLGPSRQECPFCGSTFTYYVGEHKLEGKVEGNSASDVVKVVRAMLSDAKKMGKEMNKIGNITINGGTFGILSTGVIKNIETISMNVGTLESSGKKNLSDAFKAITEAIASSEEISKDQRTEFLDQLEELSKQAILPPEQRLKPSIINSIITGIGAGIAAAGGIAEVWSTWGPQIRSFFGV